MTSFNLYLQLGFEHIADFRGYDHILFLFALSAVYEFKHWKRVLILVTAFTIGHSITLALATLKFMHISTDLIELLIPVTILTASIFNIVSKNESVSYFVIRFKYFTALFFGLIHGLGFSNYLQGLLGNETNIVKPLFAFNLGLELGQILIVFIILFLAFIAMNIIKMIKREWNLIISGACLGISIILIVQRSVILLN
jgi:hypothetical protein